jgi:hypothetical protein
MLCIVGHGPSLLLRLGAVIDTCTVVRLKFGLPKDADPEVWGTRTDYLCARSHLHQSSGPFWIFNDPPKWIAYYRKFSRKKPSTGLCAVFCAIDHLNPPEIAVIGYDRLLNPADQKSGKWNKPVIPGAFGTGSHDQRAEHACLMSLPVRIIDLAKEHSGKAP